MRSAMFALLAVTAIASSSGCCCLERWWCKPWGCQGGCGGGCDSCGGGCDSCGAGNGGYVGYEGEGGGGGGCGCGAHGGGGGGDVYAGGKVQPHPHAHYARNDGGQQFFDSGPAVPSVTYPYYTNRGPRDYLAKNPRGIGP
jgi:hypothetical protein